MLVVEVDGPGHERPAAKLDDARKDRKLRAAGYTVLRFTTSRSSGTPRRCSPALSGRAS